KPLLEFLLALPYIYIVCFFSGPTLYTRTQIRLRILGSVSSTPKLLPIFTFIPR
ncbi:hypothetical protein ACRALDRAFT_2114185, partial [Sodiomyces alcalophilus JCM 7366]